MAKSKNQHYVPQYYFRWFSDDSKKTNLLRKEDGRIVIGAGIGNQSSASYFYGDASAEDEIGKIEQTQRTALQAIRRTVALVGPDISAEVLTQARAGMLFQRARTLMEREKHAKPMENMLNELARMHLEMKGVDSKDPENAFHVQVNPQHVHLNRLRLAKLEVLLTSDLAVALLRNDTANPFIFGDAPAVPYNQHLLIVRDLGVLGAQTPGLQFFFPISPTLLLFWYDPKVYTVAADDKNVVHVTQEEDVSALNKLQLHNAHSCVYFGKPDKSEYVRALWEQEIEGHGRVLGEFEKGQGYDSQSGAKIGTIFHMFEPQVQYPLRLSFVRGNAITDPGEYMQVQLRRPELAEVFNSASERAQAKRSGDRKSAPT